MLLDEKGSDLRFGEAIMTGVQVRRRRVSAATEGTADQDDSTFLVEDDKSKKRQGLYRTVATRRLGVLLTVLVCFITGCLISTLSLGPPAPLVAVDYANITSPSHKNKEIRRTEGKKTDELVPSNAVHVQPNSRRVGRFPKYGTDEFSRQCHWAMDASPARNCTFYFSPGRTTEGLSSWVGLIAQIHQSARQVGCRVVFDYGPDGLDLSEVLSPLPSSGSGLNGQLNNWAVPSGFRCMRDNFCFNFGEVSNAWKILGTPKLAFVPIYRGAYKNYRLRRESYKELERALPGFKLESGMACSLGSLFHLPMSVSKFEPDLFTRILPKLQDEETLVMSLYIRTGWADVMADQELGKKLARKDFKGIGPAEKYVNCALYLEEQYLSGKVEPELTFSRIVWMVVSDSSGLKHAMVESFSRVPTHTSKQKLQSQTIQREVLVSASRGTHTRPSRNVTPADFVGAFLDWYLIGESDLVIADTNKYTYGSTGALRTARPLYDIRSSPCSRSVLVDEDGPLSTQ